MKLTRLSFYLIAGIVLHVAVPVALAQQPDTNAIKRAEAQKEFQAQRAKEFADCKAKAETGDPAAQFALSQLYAFGTGVKEDRAEMMKWLRLAAVGNHGLAQRMLADFYDYPPGRFMKQDFVESYAWRYVLMKPKGDYDIHPNPAARQGKVVRTGPLPPSNSKLKIFPTDARTELANYTPQEVAAGKVRATQLQAEIDARLGQMAAKKSAADSVKYANRFQESKAKAEAGNPEAQFNLAECYKRGEGVAKNETEMMKWYFKSAGMGFAKAQLEVGNDYKSGAGGLKRDPVEAYAWLSLACERIPYACPTALANEMSPAQLAAGKEHKLELSKQIQSQPGAIKNRLPGMFPGPLK